MTERQNPRDRLRALAENLNLPLEDVLGDLLKDSPLQTPSAAPAAPSPIPLTDAAIRAAISDSYSTSEIGVSVSERELLDQSQMIMIGGRRRLRLSDEARGAILREASGSERYGVLLRQAIAHDQEMTPATDEVGARSACLRRFLDGTPGDLTSASPAELRAAVAALERLRAVPLASTVPSLGEAQRLLEYAELLEPLRISIGATGPWTQPPSADRFVGRDKEVRQLRSFVDEIESESALESIQRRVTGTGDAFRRGVLGDTSVLGVRFIVARGGLGKSALIAKFVLDHALKQTRRFPFAYVDFDRAAIQARDPRHLLLEVVRQVALQFAEIAKELGALRERIRQSLAASAATPNVDPFDDFRTLIRNRVTLGERALLVVFDTLEIVQFDLPALKGVLAFLERLGRGFTELRIVAAGRAEAPELVAATSSRRQGTVIPLDPLSQTEAAEMVRRLGTSLMASEWNDMWTHRLAGKSTDPPERREPLSLRVAVETLRDESPDKRESRSIEIERLGEDADTSFVGKLYMNRVVGHVAGGEDVRKLAWPGLVVRRVSVKIIQELLAPRLGVDPSRAQALFDALATQLWIVVHDGDALKHQQDLRARTLPLMRRKTEFLDINAAAVEYFAARRSESPQNRAEWIYHRLLGAESPASVDADWSDSVVQFLKDAHEDFPKDSAAADYLAARTSDRLQPDQLIARLDPRMAILHLARAGLQKANLTDRTIDPLLVTLPIASVHQSTLSGPAAAVRIALLVKTGRWQDIDEDRVDSEGPWQQQAAAAIAFRRARMMRSDGEPVVAQELEREYAGDGAIERASLVALIQDLAACRIHGLGPGDLLDNVVARQLERGVSVVDLTIGLPMLRTAMVFGRRATVPAARLWVTQVTEQIRASALFAFSARELRALAEDDEMGLAARRAIESAGAAGEGVFSGAPAARKRFDDPKLVGVISDALRSRCERGEPRDLHALRAFAAARDEDWLLPLAYAAHRATAGQVPKGMADLYETYQPLSRSFLQRNLLGRTVVPTDIVEVLARADEASDVAGAARLFTRDGDGTHANDLKALLGWYDAWRASIEGLLNPST